MNKDHFSYSLTFRLDFFDDRTGLWGFLSPKRYIDFSDIGVSGEEVYRRVRRHIYHMYGLKLFSGAWTEVELNQATIAKLTDMFATLKAGHVGYIGSAGLREAVRPEAVETLEWFVIGSHEQDNKSFRFDAGYPTCKACKYSPLVHIQNDSFVSEKFRNVVISEGLSGLEFLWIKDEGNYAAPQWYAAIAMHPIGHGIDHPWFDINGYDQFASGEHGYLGSRYQGHLSASSIALLREDFGRSRGEGMYRRGVSIFDIGTIARNFPEDAAIKSLLAYCPKIGIEGGGLDRPPFP